MQTFQLKTFRFIRLAESYKHSLDQWVDRQCPDSLSLYLKLIKFERLWPVFLSNIM